MYCLKIVILYQLIMSWNNTPDIQIIIFFKLNGSQFIWRLVIICQPLYSWTIFSKLSSAMKEVGFRWPFVTQNFKTQRTLNEVVFTLSPKMGRVDQFLPQVIALFHTSLKACLSKSTPYGTERDVIVDSWYFDSLHLISCGDLLHRTGGKETSYQ